MSLSACQPSCPLLRLWSSWSSRALVSNTSNRVLEDLRCFLSTSIALSPRWSTWTFCHLLTTLLLDFRLRVMFFRPSSWWYTVVDSRVQIVLTWILEFSARLLCIARSGSTRNELCSATDSSALLLTLLLCSRPAIRCSICCSVVDEYLIASASRNITVLSTRYYKCRAD